MLGLLFDLWKLLLLMVHINQYANGLLKNKKDPEIQGLFTNMDMIDLLWLYHNL